MALHTTREPLAERFAVIVGCDAVGSHLAARLEHDGCAVRLIGRHRAALAAVPDRLAAACVAGDPLDPAVLRRAGIDEADILVAATSADERNAAVALLALRLFATAHVFARIDDPGRAASYGRLGIATVCSTPAVAAAFMHGIGAVADR